MKSKTEDQFLTVEKGDIQRFGGCSNRHPYPWDYTVVYQVQIDRQYLRVCAHCKNILIRKLKSL